MRVLIGCEYSATVREAFKSRGHDAVSCDIDHGTDIDGAHYLGDMFDMLCLPWDLIIAHPPCTALTVAGNSTYGAGKPKHHMRLEAAAWTEKLWYAALKASPRVCFENPVGVLGRFSSLPKATFVHPWQHGHLEQKKTGLFLHNLPALVPTYDVHDAMMRLPVNKRQRLHYLPPSPDRWKIRSVTFPGIAAAMADQWGAL